MKKKEYDLIKYYTYPRTNLITSRKNTSVITGQGMILRHPISPDKMDMIIYKYLNSI